MAGLAEGVGAGAILGGVVLSAGVGVSGATTAGLIWRALRPTRDGIAEPALALFGLIGTASVLTAVLLLLWGAPSFVGEPTTLDDPLFAASLVGTVGGHLAVLAWARTIGAPLAAVRVGPRWIAAGLGVGLAALLVSGVWVAIAERLGFSIADQGLVSTLTAAPPGLGRSVTVLFVVAVAPVLEELVFRGYLQTALTTRAGALTAGMLSAVAFGLFHLSDPAVVPVLTIIGGLLAWVRYRSGSVVPAILGHVVNNAAAMAIALWMG
jgi:membrane protease YdiL (CAAX protease family)